MTHLQQICADMVDSQYQLQYLYTFARGLRREPKASAALREQVRHATAVHTEFVTVCGRALMRHPASNDAVNLPGAE